MQSRTAAISCMYSSVAVFCHSNVESEEEIVSMQHSPQLSIPTDVPPLCVDVSARNACASSALIPSKQTTTTMYASLDTLHGVHWEALS